MYAIRSYYVNFPAALSTEFNDMTIHFAYESSPGVVWLYLSGHGCIRIISSPESSNYEWTWFNETNLLPSNGLNFIQKAADGGLWIGTDVGLCHLPNDRVSLQEKNNISYYLSDTKRSITAIYEHDDTAWIGCKTGEFYELNQDSTRLIWQSTHKNAAFNRFCFIRESRDGLIYGGTRNGMIQYNPQTGAINHMTARNSQLTTNYITDCVITSYSIHYTKLYDFMASFIIRLIFSP